MSEQKYLPKIKKNKLVLEKDDQLQSPSKKFICESCGKRFTRKDNMNVHRRTSCQVIKDNRLISKIIEKLKLDNDISPTNHQVINNLTQIQHSPSLVEVIEKVMVMENDLKEKSIQITF